MEKYLEMVTKSIKSEETYTKYNQVFELQENSISTGLIDYETADKLKEGDIYLKYDSQKDHYGLLTETPVFYSTVIKKIYDENKNIFLITESTVEYPKKRK